MSARIGAWVRLPSVQRLAVGTSRWRGDVCLALCDAALELGYRSLDTSESYRNHREIGTSMERSGLPRDSITVTSKLHLTSLTRDSVPSQTRRMLDEMQTDYVDCLLIHWPSREIPVAVTIEAMQRLRGDGLVRNLGVSNFTCKLLLEALEIDSSIAVNQIECHPFLQQKQLRALMRSRGVATMASRPTALGAAARDPTIMALASSLRCTPHQLVLRFLLSDRDTIAVPGTGSVRHLSENIETLRLGPLPATAKHAIAALDQGRRTLDRAYAPDWD